MLDQEEIQKRYNENLPLFLKTKEEVSFIINSMLEKTEIKIHSIQSRIKEFSSILKKAENLEIAKEEEVFIKIQDIVGLRIICLFLSDIEEISNHLRQSFDVVYEDNKLDGSDISSFGYFSVHFICKLKKEYRGPRYDSLKDFEFEIQIRTISMDAWANISHYLDYKSDIEIPKDLKKDFFALSGLFYVADTHFEMFFKNKKEQAKIAKQDVSKNIDADINFETLEAFIDSRFKKRKPASSGAISHLTQEIVGFDIKTINQLDSILTQFFEKKPESKAPSHLNRVGIVRYSLSNHVPGYRQYTHELLRGTRNNKKND